MAAVEEDPMAGGMEYQSPPKVVSLTLDNPSLQDRTEDNQNVYQCGSLQLSDKNTSQDDQVGPPHGSSRSAARECLR